MKLEPNTIENTDDTVVDVPEEEINQGGVPMDVED